MKIIWLLLLLFFINNTQTQNLSGVWVQEYGAENARLVIVKTDGHYVGYTYDEGGGSFCQANFTGSFDSSKQKLKGINNSFIKKGFLHGLSRYNLNYYVNDNGREYLKGTIHPKSVGATILSFGMPKFIRYSKLSDKVEDTTAFMQGHLTLAENPTNEIQLLTYGSTVSTIQQLPDTTPVALTIPAEITQAKNNRIADTLSSIRTAAKTITIKLMDNGIVDGDTISIMHNGKLVVNRLGVQLQPYTFTVQIDEDQPIHEITMIAHNLGSIPPNSALVIIEAGDKTYRLTSSTDLQRNSVLLVLHDKQPQP